MNCFDLLWGAGEEATSSFGDSTGVFPQNWLPPQLSYKGLLEVTGVHFDVIVRGLIRAAKSVRFGAESVVSNVTEDGRRPRARGAVNPGDLSGCSLCCRGRAYGSSN